MNEQCLPYIDITVCASIHFSSMSTDAYLLAILRTLALKYCVDLINKYIERSSTFPLHSRDEHYSDRHFIVFQVKIIILKWCELTSAYLKFSSSAYLSALLKILLVSCMRMRRSNNEVVNSQKDVQRTVEMFQRFKRMRHLSAGEGNSTRFICAFSVLWYILTKT